MLALVREILCLCTSSVSSFAVVSSSPALIAARFAFGQARTVVACIIGAPLYSDTQGRSSRDRPIILGFFLPSGPLRKLCRFVSQICKLGCYTSKVSPVLIIVRVKSLAQMRMHETLLSGANWGGILVHPKHYATLPAKWAHLGVALCSLSLRSCLLPRCTCTRHGCLGQSGPFKMPCEAPLFGQTLGPNWHEAHAGSSFAAKHLPPLNSPFGGQVFGPDRHKVHAGIEFCGGAFAVGQSAQVLPLELRAAPQPPRGELAAVHVAARQQHAHAHLCGSCQVLNGRCRKLECTVGDSRL